MDKQNIMKMPLNDSQMGVFLECVDDMTNLKYNIVYHWSIKKDGIDKEKLVSSYKKATQNHKSFSSSIIVENGTPYIIEIDKQGKFYEEFLSENELSSYIETFTKPFNFDGKPMCFSSIVETEEKYHILINIHHLFADGLSFAVLTKEIKMAYDGQELPREQSNPFTESQREIDYQSSEELKNNYLFYEKYLEDFDSDSRFIPDVDDNSLSKDKLINDVYTSFCDTDILPFAKSIGVNENTIFLGALAYTLSLFTMQDDILLSSVEGGRFNRDDMLSTTGMFVKTFPVRIKANENTKVSEYLQSVKASFVSSMKNDKVSFAELAKRHHITSSITYAYQAKLLGTVTLGNNTLYSTEIETKHAIGDFNLMVFKVDGKYLLRFLTRKSLYSKDMILSIFNTMEKVILSFLTSNLLKDIDGVTNNQLELMDKFNDNKLYYDDTKNVVDIFNDTVKKYPNNIALYYNNKQYTYEEFDKITNKVANFINQKNIGKDNFVSILVGRNDYMAIGSWGVIKAGAAYQPLDPTYPKERLNFMLKDSKAKLLICDRALRNIVDEYNGDILYTDEIENLTNFEPLNIQISPSNALIIIYTSGTTGTPKGCILEHKNILCFFYNHTKYMGIDNTSRLAQYASFGFDAGLMDIFTTLMCGAGLYIIPDSIRLDLALIDEFYIEHKITHGFMTTQVGRMFAEITKCPTLKTFMLGGEKLVPFNPPKNFKVINAYGPSETTVYVTHFVVKDDNKIQPIGMASNNTKLYVLNSKLKKVPIGALGELCVAGNQVGRGYLGRDDKTKEVFVPNPFSAEKGYDKMYRTGDIVRLLPNGNFEFVGRRDGQVKIRGFRIELTEVEQIIRSFSGIDNATVQAFSEASGGMFLAAFIVSKQKIDINSLNEYILNEKPAYMVPAVTMQIDSIPLNANGKVDKKKLPVPVKKAEEIIKPQNKLEQDIFDIASSIIGSTEFGVNTDLFTVGLSSISSIKFNASLSDKFNVVVKMSDLKKQGNIQNLAKFISQSKPQEQPTIQVYSDYPITKTQEGIYIECISHPGETTYNIPLLLKLDSNIKINRLKLAITEAINAHSYIDTRLFLDKDGNVRQSRPSLGSFTKDDIEEVSINNIEDVKDTLVQPFNLLNSRLFRIQILKGIDTYLFMDIHHIINDGTSMQILVSDIEKAYNGQKVEDETYTGFDKASDEVKERNSVSFSDAEEFYKNLLDGLDTDFLPHADKHALSNQGSGNLLYTSNVDTAKLSKFLATNNIGANAVLCSAFGYTLSLYNGSDYSIFTTVYNGRNDPRLARTMSMLVKTLPVVCKPIDNIVEYIKATSDQLINSMTNDIYSFAEISHEFNLKSDIMFIFQGDGFAFNNFCGLPCSEIKLSLSEEKAPITIQASIVNDCLNYEVGYNNNLYTNEFILALIKTLDRVISGFISQEKLTDILLVDDDELRIMNLFNDNKLEYDESKTVIDIYDEIVKKYPDNIACVYKDKVYSYNWLDKISNQVANYIIDKGIQRDEFVSILVNRNDNMVTTSLGVIKSGAAYQPLDPTYPKERLNFMIKDSKARLLICERSLRDVVDEYQGDILYTDEIDSLSVKPLKKVDIRPQDAFIIIYTSGTTGTPKGCVLEHKNIVCFNYNHIKNIGLDSNSRVAQYASFGFDAGVMDIFTTLMTGAGLYIIPDDIRLDLSLIDKFYNDNAITHGFMTTQVGRMFAEKTTSKTIKTLLLGGEKLVPFTPQKSFNVINGYGPSETIAYVSHYVVRDDGKVQPIGKASNNTKLYVVSKDLKALPIGACGELCIAGNQVGREYLGREDKTKEVFVSNPFTKEKGYDKMYRTGDIVRLLPDGNFDFVGRRDGQVKIRGFRVELTEVEQVIRSFKGIDNATVQAFNNNSGGKFLAAYIVSKQKINIDDLNKFILEQKPAYMVPTVTMQIDSIPLNANSKVDKRKLPVPERQEKIGKEPVSDIEKKICSIYENLLGIKKVYADDNFFEIGGTSILALQLVVKLSNEGINVVYKNIFENSTPSSLASFVQGVTEEKDFFASDKTKHNYSALEYNNVDNLDNVSTKGLGDVLLTGSTGFLGSHTLINLLDNSKGKIICVIRNKKDLKAIDRLKTILEYYFERILSKEDLEKLIIVEGDLADIETERKLKNIHIDTILNCAANVKHFGAEDKIMKDNSDTVDVLIRVAKEHNAMLVHASSLSVAGESVNNIIPKSFVFSEQDLNIGQSLENLYCRSKYFAEEKIIDEIPNGLRAKIIRFGNLMARSPDSEFQINADGNGFLRMMKGYAILGYAPYDILDTPIEFSPIDCAASAMILLAGTPDKFTCFHANNSHWIHFANVFEAMNEAGFDIKPVSMEKYNIKLKELFENNKDGKDFTGLIAYNNTADSKQTTTRFQPSKTNAFTTKVLYRLGFSWPIIDYKYLKQLIKLQKEGGFFDL